ncbi:uncharacterized protein LOC144421110 [Styela clava]
MTKTISTKFVACCCCLFSISGFNLVKASPCIGSKFSGSGKIPSVNCPNICKYTFHSLGLNNIKLLILNVTRNRISNRERKNCYGQFQIDTVNLAADADIPLCYILYPMDCVEPVELTKKLGCNALKVTDSLAKVYLGQDIHSALTIYYEYKVCVKEMTKTAKKNKFNIAHNSSERHTD